MSNNISGKVLRGIREYRGKYRIERTYQGQRKSAVVDTLEQALVARDRLDRELRGELIEAPAPTAPAPVTPAGVVPPVTKTSPSFSLGGCWTLKEAVEMTFLRCWRHTADEGNQKLRTAHLLEFFGEDTFLDDITTDQILRFRQWCEKTYGNSDTTINRKVCALSRTMRTAVEHDKLSRVPKMPLVRENNARLRFLTLDEERSTLATFETHTTQNHVDAFIVLLDTGFRMGELRGLRKNQVNFEQKTLYLKDGETKNRQGRTVYATERVLAVLQRRIMETTGDKLFPYTHTWFAKGWNKVRDLLGKTHDKEWVPHMLRHTCCSRLVQANVDLFLVQRWMGHKDLAVTQRYAHHAPDSMRMAGAALERLTKGKT